MGASKQEKKQAKKERKEKERKEKPLEDWSNTDLRDEAVVRNLNKDLPWQVLAQLIKDQMEEEAKAVQAGTSMPAGRASEEGRGSMKSRVSRLSLKSDGSGKSERAKAAYRHAKNKFKGIFSRSNGKASGGGMDHGIMSSIGESREVDNATMKAPIVIPETMNEEYENEENFDGNNANASNLQPSNTNASDGTPPIVNASNTGKDSMKTENPSAQNLDSGNADCMNVGNNVVSSIDMGIKMDSSKADGISLPGGNMNGASTSQSRIFVNANSQPHQDPSAQFLPITLRAPPSPVHSESDLVRYKTMWISHNTVNTTNYFTPAQEAQMIKNKLKEEVASAPESELVRAGNDGDRRVYVNKEGFSDYQESRETAKRLSLMDVEFQKFKEDNSSKITILELDVDRLNGNVIRLNTSLAQVNNDNGDLQEKVYQHERKLQETEEIRRLNQNIRNRVIETFKRDVLGLAEDRTIIDLGDRQAHDGDALGDLSLWDTGTRKANEAHVYEKIYGWKTTQVRGMETWPALIKLISMRGSVSLDYEIQAADKLKFSALIQKIVGDFMGLDEDRRDNAFRAYGALRGQHDNIVSAFEKIPGRCVKRYKNAKIFGSAW